jgi:Amt family ammonium transporter
LKNRRSLHAALAVSIYLAKRRAYGSKPLAYITHNTADIVFTAILLWGPDLRQDSRSPGHCIVTILAALVGEISWMLWDYRLEKKRIAVGFCSGTISGLLLLLQAHSTSELVSATNQQLLIYH